MTYEQLKPLLAWRVGSLRGWTPTGLSASLGDVPYEEVPAELFDLLVGFRHRRQDGREAVCRRFLEETRREVRVAADGGVTLKMSVLEARALRRLLERAGDEFSNHGCNDFSVEREVNGTPEDGLGLLRAMVESGAADKEQLEGASGKYLLDWQLMRHFERRVEKALRAHAPTW